MPPIQPIISLVPNARAMFGHAQTALGRALVAPAEPEPILAAFLFIHQLKDWDKPDGDHKFWAGCPFAQTISEVANGTKHLTLKDPKLTSQPHVSDMAVRAGMSGAIGGAPVGALPVGGSEPDYIVVRTRRNPTDVEQDFRATDIVAEALRWWDAALQP